MARELSIASIQLPAFPKGTMDHEIKGNNFQAALHWLELAGEAGADIACLGEMFNIRGIHLTGENFFRSVEGDFEHTQQVFQEIASRHQMYIIAPIYSIMNGTPRNQAIIIGRDGRTVGSYYKVHCTEDERSLGIVPGDDWPVFHLDFGTVGIEICHDISFPESARCLTLNGAEIVFWPHVMSGWGEYIMDTLMRSPSVHNGIVFVPACYGCEPGTAWRPGEMPLGHSSIIGPDGITLADAGHKVGIALTNVNLDQPRVAHEFTRKGDYVWQNDMLRDRRPETYHAILRPNPNLEPVAGRDLE